MKIKIVKGKNVIAKFDTEKTNVEQPNFNQNARLGRNYKPQHNIMKVSVDLPNGNGINTDMKKIKQAKIDSQEEEHQNVVINDEIALKLQQSMMGLDEEAVKENNAKMEEYSNSILNQYSEPEQESETKYEDSNEEQVAENETKDNESNNKSNEKIYEY